MSGLEALPRVCSYTPMALERGVCGSRGGGTYSRAGCEETGADLAWEGAWGGEGAACAGGGGALAPVADLMGGLGCCQDLAPL